MRLEEWLALVLDNKSVVSVKASTLENRMTRDKVADGVAIKLPGEPSYEIFFQIDGDDVFVNWFGHNGRYVDATDPGSQHAMQGLMTRFTGPQGCPKWDPMFMSCGW